MGSADVVKGLYDSFAKGDIQSVLAAFDDKIEWREADNFLYADGNPFIGPDAIVQGVLSRLPQDFAGFSVNAERIIDGGDTVAVEGRYRGTYKATGTPVDAEFCHVWTLEGGKVKAFQQYTDTAQFREAASS